MSVYSDVCIQRGLVHEGGYVNHPADKGGPTNKGITLATFRRHINNKGTIADLKALTVAQAVRVYKNEYWDKVRGDELPRGVAHFVYDFGINSGPHRAITSLQEELGVARDGVIGPLTLAAAKRADPKRLINTLHDNRMAFLRELSNWPTFGDGWTTRVNRVRDEALGDVLLNKPTPAKVAAPTDGLFGLIARFFAALFART